ncbi:unnamed protein product [Coffea canephora]|uniref:Reverse transcriptase domain-containing protein n=1 Tax=Coffea canephora TaxID=49390 RepID=A0A068UEL7_COFCA|nr:unnamed protein product [Coffea canephora]
MNLQLHEGGGSRFLLLLVLPRLIKLLLNGVRSGVLNEIINMEVKSGFFSASTLGQATYFKHQNNLILIKPSQKLNDFPP